MLEHDYVVKLSQYTISIDYFSIYTVVDGLDKNYPGHYQYQQDTHFKHGERERETKKEKLSTAALTNF